MKFNSTRGIIKGLSLEDAIFTGYAEDGGILLPETIPQITLDQLKAWSSLSYTELAKQIIPMFVTEEDIPRETLNGLLDAAFSTFTHPEVAPFKHLKDNLNVMELFHGKTWAFKDLALSCVGQFYNYFCAKRKQHFIILVGTSGDTGSAAIEAVRGLKWVDIIVLLPKGRISEIQERQMTSVIEDNVHVFRVDGTSDDLDRPVKNVLSDVEFKRQHRLSCINSINWARIMIQTVHYFYAYLQICPSCDNEVQIIVPTGACGNVMSGCVARKMGLPVQFVCAVNKNDIVSRTISSGDFSMTEVTPTLATAMDIQMPYNMERIWYLYSNGDTKLIRKLMQEFENNSKTQVPEELAVQVRKAIVDTYVGSDDDVRATMKRCWDENGYVLCPHTALAVAYYYDKMKRSGASDGVPSVCIATASAAKFPEATKAAGLTLSPSADVITLLSKPTRSEDMNKGENWEEMLRKKIEEVTQNFENRKT
ncbi:hypothetical protein CHS0354_036440 [Potamilus streckersoni]|uniref:Threonine synthase-like 2 n=1 Tax=Potamilus streckersoni TaxID=2493646 RepID=A0AAE0SWI5_9BIVA|nr:hypothetical protein CHS0354_036440 [Potamilus streckersoni]